MPLFVASDGRAGKSDDYKEFRFVDTEQSNLITLLNSSLFYWFWHCNSDGFHCGYGDVNILPYRQVSDAKNRAKLRDLEMRLMKELRGSAAERTISTKAGTVRYQEFSPKAAKPIIDEIDRVFAEHYGFTDEELDFIINYDIKYRMGRSGAEEE